MESLDRIEQPFSDDLSGLIWTSIFGLACPPKVEIQDFERENSEYSPKKTGFSD